MKLNNCTVNVDEQEKLIQQINKNNSFCLKFKKKYSGKKFVMTIFKKFLSQQFNNIYINFLEVTFKQEFMYPFFDHYFHQLLGMFENSL